MIAGQQLARVFSGIQPTGIPHLGNYFGALVPWLKLAKHRQVRLPEIYSTLTSTSTTTTTTSERANKRNDVIQCDSPIYCIVDVHAYSSPKTLFGQSLYEQILSTTASLLALGLTPQNCNLFRQSDLFEHNYLDNVLDNFVSTQRLALMTQFKDKIASQPIAFKLLEESGTLPENVSEKDVKSMEKRKQKNRAIPNGLLNYPVLQAADILLYRSHLVPVGDDQLQHIELTRDIARKFNQTTGSNLFPEPKALLSESKQARRIKSLREPEKKMSKSDADKKSFIELVDEPEMILEKVKKSLTDSISAVYYDAEQRPGISNLMRIHHLITGQSFDQIRQDYATTESAKYKLALADLIIEHLKPVRQEYNKLKEDRFYLEQVLAIGKERVQPLANETITKVRQALGSIASG